MAKKQQKSANSSVSSYLVYKCILRANEWSPTMHGETTWDHEGRGSDEGHHKIAGHHSLAIRAHLYTFIPSNLMILLFFGHFGSQMTVYDDPRGEYMGSLG